MHCALRWLTSPTRHSGGRRALPYAPAAARRYSVGSQSHWLERLVGLDKPQDFIGKSALREIAGKGADRRLVGVEIEGKPLIGNDRFWDVRAAGEVCGHLTRCAWSPLLERNIGLVNVPIACTGQGSRLEIGARTAGAMPQSWTCPGYIL